MLFMLKWRNIYKKLENGFRMANTIKKKNYENCKILNYFPIQNLLWVMIIIEILCDVLIKLGFCQKIYINYILTNINVQHREHKKK